MNTIDQHANEITDEDGQPIDRSYFWTEGCAAFALHLARELQLQGKQAEIAVISNCNGEAWSDDHPFEFTHVVVSTSEGYVDVNGEESDAESVSKKIFEMDINVEGDWDVDVFERDFVGSDDEKPLYGGDEQITMWIKCLLEAEPERYGLNRPVARPRP